MNCNWKEGFVSSFSLLFHEIQGESLKDISRFVDEENEVPVQVEVRSKFVNRTLPVTKSCTVPPV